MLLQMHHPIQMKPADSENRNGEYLFYSALVALIGSSWCTGGSHTCLVWPDATILITMKLLVVSIC